MLRKQKEKIVAEIQDQIKDSRLLILSTFTGLNVDKATQLRKSLREAASNYRVVKNTLMRKAAQGTELESLAEHFVGSSALIFTKEDPVQPCKVVKVFRKENEQVEIKGAVFEGKVLGKDEIEAIADLPSKEVLIAKFLFLLKSPQHRLVNVLAGVARNFVQVLEAIKQKKENQQ